MSYGNNSPEKLSQISIGADHAKIWGLNLYNKTCSDGTDQAGTC